MVLMENAKQFVPRVIFSCKCHWSRLATVYKAPEFNIVELKEKTEKKILQLDDALVPLMPL